MFESLLHDGPSTKSEQVFELLTLGTLWRVYGQDACDANRFGLLCLRCLATLRLRGGRTKAWVDVFRGWLFTLLSFVRFRAQRQTRVPSKQDLAKLLTWLEATGEYLEEVARLHRWLAYFDALSVAEIETKLDVVVTFADWFEDKANIALGRYTMHIDTFLRRKTASYRWREDAVSCTKARVEYHLSMVGAFVLNEAFRPAFDACKRHVLLVPGCMRRLPAEHCQAASTRRGSICTHCVPNCEVHRLTRLGENRGFEVMMLHHASDLSVWTPEAGEEPAGVVGVACVPQLIGGGWKLESLGIPAQCVILDGCGCRAHWSTKGFPTTVCHGEVVRILSCKSEGCGHKAA